MGRAKFVWCGPHPPSRLVSKVHMAGTPSRGVEDPEEQERFNIPVLSATLRIRAATNGIKMPTTSPNTVVPVPGMWRTLLAYSIYALHYAVCLSIKIISIVCLLCSLTLVVYSYERGGDLGLTSGSSNRLLNSLLLTGAATAGALAAAAVRPAFIPIWLNWLLISVALTLSAIDDIGEVHLLAVARLVFLMSLPVLRLFSANAILLTPSGRFSRTVALLFLVDGHTRKFWSTVSYIDRLSKATIYFLLAMVHFFFFLVTAPNVPALLASASQKIPQELHQFPVPRELEDHIISLLDGPSRSRDLQSLSLTSRGLNRSTRPFLFEHICITSVPELSKLVALLSPINCTIPCTSRTLSIDLQLSKDADAEHDAMDRDVCSVLEHFERVVTVLTVNLPWLIGRGMEWDCLATQSTLKKLVLSGAYSWLWDLTHAISSMASLEILVVDAVWKPRYSAVDAGSASTDRPPQNLKELCLSSSSLILLAWMCEVEDKPDGLHVVRIKVEDDPDHHEAFKQISEFLLTYGLSLSHLYLWFEGWDFDQLESYRAVRAGLSHVHRLHQLELFFPLEYDETEVQDAVRLVSEGVGPHIVSSRGGYKIHNEVDFWGTPRLCCEPDIHWTLYSQRA
ncbi:hypothetical protein NMY22_g3591 [Coprinellus aureogranulatus]|nr:hypothetical protein NMY22_g3591 [Coprinellus aureogranulatus]